MYPRIEFNDQISFDLCLYLNVFVFVKNLDCFLILKVLNSKPNCSLSHQNDGNRAFLDKISMSKILHFGKKIKVNVLV